MVLSVDQIMLLIDIDNAVNFEICMWTWQVPFSLMVKLFGDGDEKDQTGDDADDDDDGGGKDDTGVRDMLLVSGDYH